jgi:hypothetical protein
MKRLLLAVTLLSGCVHAQMVDPAIDRNDEPFSYFSHPTDVIGVMDNRVGTLISPEGYLFTGYGELMFFMGNPPQPAAQRVKTLYRGYLPIIEYTYHEGAVEYRVTAFAVTLDGKPESPLMNFVRVRAVNTGNVPHIGHFATGMRYVNDFNMGNGQGDNRFRRPATPKRVGEYSQPGVQWSFDWTYGFSDDGFLRDGKLMYVFPSRLPHIRSLTLKQSYNNKPDIATRKLDIQKSTPAGIVRYDLPLKPGAQQVLEFRLPYEPLPLDSPLVAQLRSASFDEYLDRTVKFWDDIFARGLEITVPEAKVNDTFKANLVYDLIARDKIGDQYVQTVNKFQYHAFWLRDSSYIARMYDISGYHDIARQVLDFFAGWQQPDGNFVSQGGQFDGWGQTMWAYGQHYRITHDDAFAAEVYPSVQKAVAWLKQARASDPLHVMPSTRPGDNEDISGHVTGHNFWALAGLRNAFFIAKGLGKVEDAQALLVEYNDYKSELDVALKRITAKTGGYIPPGLDVVGGQDWGNMLSVYPEQVLDPMDPMVTATLNATRAKYREGIMTYGDGRWLHHYLTLKNTEAEIIRGDQQMAVEELYALLVHTSSTHAGFEFCIFPWGDRDFANNLSPHGWFAAKFRTALRNMLVREQVNDLHLLSVVSPEWIKPGQSISVKRAPTNFGPVSLEMSFTETGAALNLDLPCHEVAQTVLGRICSPRVILHLPWFMETTRIVADGEPLEVTGDAIQLPSDTKQVQLTWTRRPDAPALSFGNAVREYKAEYRRRYERWQNTGETTR